jgi:hypothetical protein
MSGGIVQEFGVQTPCNVQTPLHPACVVTEQLPEGGQHAPVGCEHGLGVQVVPAPCQVWMESQATCVATVQTPAWVQHAPVGITGGVGSSFPQPTKTIAISTIRIPSLPIVEPPSCHLSSRGRSGSPIPTPALLRQHPISRDPSVRPCSVTVRTTLSGAPDGIAASNSGVTGSALLLRGHPEVRDLLPRLDGLALGTPDPAVLCSLIPKDTVKEWRHPSHR